AGSDPRAGRPGGPLAATVRRAGAGRGPTEGPVVGAVVRTPPRGTAAAGTTGPRGRRPGRAARRGGHRPPYNEPAAGRARPCPARAGNDPLRKPPVRPRANGSRRSGRGQRAASERSDRRGTPRLPLARPRVPLRPGARRPFLKPVTPRLVCPYE